MSAKNAVRLIFAVTAIAMLAVMASGGAAPAQPANEFYKSKQIELLITGSVGGAYDIYARALARFMKDHIPGSPAIIPKQMIGAGGLTAMNYLANIAPKDGTVIGLVNNPVPYLPLLGETKALYDPAKMNWLGSMAGEVALLIVWQSAPVTSLDDVLHKEITVASAGAGSGSDFYARLLNGAIGTKLKIISGYKGSADGLLAMERGEVDGWSDIMWSTLHITKPQWVEKNQIRILVQIAVKKHPELPDVPLALDYAKSEQDRRALELALAPLVGARPFVAPPEVPPERVAILREAFTATLADPAFKEELAKARIDTYGAMSGEALAELIAQQYRTPPEVVARVVEFLKMH
jgi:tripartite-type tricarboxylate transporter receptor subunit TctC